MQNEQIFNLCSEGEQVIKTYECTSIKKMFFGTSKGRLTLTNKRVLYHATGKSIKGRSLVLNEMPIDDVTGISTYMGTSINWIAMIVFTTVLYFIVTPLILNVFPSFLTHEVFGILALIPFSILCLWNKNVFSDQIKANILDNLKGISENEHVKKLQTDITKRVCLYLFVYGVYIIGIRILTTNLGILRVLLFIAIYLLFFGRSQVFSLLVFSKSTKGAGIFLPGVQQFRFLNFRTNETTAADTMSGRPARDSELVVRELGAIITDLKQIGDLAIEKWQ